MTVELDVVVAGFLAVVDVGGFLAVVDVSGLLTVVDDLGCSNQMLEFVVWRTSGHEDILGRWILDRTILVSTWLDRNERHPYHTVTVGNCQHYALVSRARACSMEHTHPYWLQQFWGAQIWFPFWGPHSWAAAVSAKQPATRIEKRISMVAINVMTGKDKQLQYILTEKQIDSRSYSEQRV